MTRTKKTGFTLIEVIIYVALLAIVLSGMVSVAWDMVYGQIKSRTQQERSHELRFLTSRIAYEIRNASSITSVSATSITLAMADAARNPTTIDLTGGRLRIGWGASGPCPTSSPCFLTSNAVVISGSGFTNYSVGSSSHINYTFTATTTNARTEYAGSSTISGSAELRD